MDISIKIILGFIFLSNIVFGQNQDLEVVYAVVAAPNEAELVYNAKLKVLPPEFLKLWTPSRSSFLNEVHIACDIAIIVSLKYQPYLYDLV